MKYYLISGEASGDMHGANLMKGILKNDPQAEFRFWGGDKMAAVGGEQNLDKHYKATSFFGFVEIAKNIRTILGQIKECKRDVQAFAPDVLILIDYPGFNFRMAKFAKSIGLTTFYYISPKVWAWKEKRVKLIRKYVDKLFIIFPFEIEYFKQKGIETIFEGNPLVDAIEEKKRSLPTRAEFLSSNGIIDDKPVVALLAGSRTTEVKNMLPFMIELSKRFPQYRFILGGVPWLDRGLYDKLLAGSDVDFVCDQTYELLNIAEAAVVTSGTATLETALIGTPEFICYRGDNLSYHIAKQFVKIRFISLVNLIMDREVVRELIQFDMTMDNATKELEAIMPGGTKREKMLADYAELRKEVGGEGASDRFAARMVELLKQTKK